MVYSIEWGKMMETLIAAGAGAAAVVFIDWVVKYYVYKKKIFQKAISIQLALHQMLVVCLQIRNFYNARKDYFIKFYPKKNLIIRNRFGVISVMLIFHLT